MTSEDFKNKLILAPMAGITDLPFRLLCKEQGADIVYTEMISAKGMMYNNKNTAPLLMTDDREKPVGVQIFGSDPVIMSEQAKRIEDSGFDFIDVNMGCPVPKVVNNGEGSALMKNPELIGEIVDKLVNTCKLPITIKIRAGFTQDEKNAPEVARIAEAAGVTAIAVHGRTRSQYYSGEADWDIIRAVREEIKIPLIGNGDVTDYESAKRIKEYTGCDSIMIGRAAEGNPWIFNEIKRGFAGETEIERPSIDEVKQMIIRHAEMMVSMKGEFTGIHEMRKHAAWYTKGLHNSSKLRARVNAVENMEDLINLLKEL